MVTVSPNGQLAGRLQIWPMRQSKKASRGSIAGSLLQFADAGNYGFGLDDVVVVVVDEEFEEGLVVVVFVLVLVFVVSLVFSFTTVEAGFTTVVLFSVFLSAGAVGETTVFSSHAPRSAAPTKRHSIFFIGCWFGGPCGAQA